MQVVAWLLSEDVVKSSLEGREHGSESLQGAILIRRMATLHRILPVKPSVIHTSFEEVLEYSSIVLFMTLFSVLLVFLFS